MNAQWAWEQGITGKGVVVTILDDGTLVVEFFIIYWYLFFIGLERNNPDLKNNYVSI